MDKIYKDSIRLIKNFAISEKNIMGVIILGSQVRKDFPGDKWSDLDILLFVNEPKEYIESEKWINSFGEVVCISKEAIDLSWIKLTWYVKRVLYTDNRTIDFSIEPYNRIDDVLEINKGIHSLGYEILYDGTNEYLTSQIKNSIRSIKNDEIIPVNINALNSITSDILFHIIYSFKKIKKNELWVAIGEINCYIKDKLLQIIEIHNSIITRKSNKLMYEGRLMECRTNNEILNMLEYCFTNYNRESAIKALKQLINTTYKIYKDICINQNFDINERQFELSQSIFSKMNDE